MIETRKGADEQTMNSEQIKSLIGATSLEEYVQKGKLPQCLPADVQITLKKVRAQADEVWSVEAEKLEVISFDYEGYTVNMTFQMDGTYLFDSVDVWAEVGNGVGVATEIDVESDSGSVESTLVTSKLAAMETVERIQQFAANLGMQLEWFEMGDERVCLMPSAVTLHYLKQQNRWKLVKIAGAYRSVDKVRAGLSRIADAVN
ncbi:hypothetical protein M3629_15225 [Paenibacillus polysaccharolyticus]|uniref:hypothetical protein n=1 Tax=Paenibacillus polysaccharolyticus TaxID=582692 RepID=UPI002041EB4B|nr:hypothetical protein [Paenibacillus polysaccharolyticus]MCM3134143.1 hypothetical protein [Paenibacillus polysaccharolyticus]